MLLMSYFSVGLPWTLEGDLALTIFTTINAAGYRRTRLNIKKKSPLNAGNFIGLDGQDAESIS
jgi:hypothetical protein